MADGEKDLVKLFTSYCNVGAGSKSGADQKGSVFTKQHCGKLADVCWVPAYKKYDAKNRIDLAYSKVVPKGTRGLDVKKQKIEEFIHKTAVELASSVKNGKAKKGERVGPPTEAEVAEVETDLIKLLKDPEVKGTKQSATGNVGGLTDASKYTGAHKERFDADGKGKGAAGREDRADNSGYVGNYKGKGTYENK